MVIVDWDSCDTAAFGSRSLSLRHALHERPMFSNEALAEVLDRYPRERLGVFTMSADPYDWSSWRRGAAGDLSGRDLLAAVEQGRIWLNLRAVNDFIESYAALAGEIFADLEGHIEGLKTFKHDVGLLISSPRAHVSYHFDATPVTLWQLRGRKRMWVYPVAEPYISEPQMEGLVLRERAEQMPYSRDWDEAAQVFVLDPGVVVSWPQNAPHRVVNDADLNVSLSIEYLTPAALMRANVLYANGLLRRRLGARPRLRGGFGPSNLVKFGVARAAKTLKLQPENPKASTAHFRLDPSRPGEPLPI